MKCEDMTHDDDAPSFSKTVRWLRKYIVEASGCRSNSSFMIDVPEEEFDINKCCDVM